jgi:hypothetical protein
MIKQNPFSLYDFLGYFIPGAFLIYLLIIIEKVKFFGNDFNFYDFLENQNEIKIEKILFFFIISYVLGHLINFFSSITIEKYSIWKYGYPSKYLLGFKAKDYFKPFTLYRLILIILIIPVAFLDVIIGELFKFKKFYTRDLDVLLISVIKDKALYLLNEKLYGKPIRNEKNELIKLRDHDIFRIIAHYVYDNSNNHQQKLTNYVILYGFLRSLTFIFVLIFWFLIKEIVAHKTDETITNFDYSNLYLFTSIILLFSYVSFMAFMKFYRRYSLEAMMLIVIDPELKPKAEKEQ